MRFRLWTSIWRVLFVREIPGDKNRSVGECDPNTNTLRILSSTRGHLRLDTLLHEMLHAVCPEKDELWVNSVATDMTEVLWQHGYRNVREIKSSKKSKSTSKK